MNFSERRLERACEYVDELWMPVSTSLVEKIKTGLVRGEFRTPESVYQQVRGDLGLFSFTVKELSKRVVQHENSIAPLNPQQLFTHAGMRHIHDVLTKDIRSTSSHSLGEMSDAQHRIIKATFISSSSSEVLARASGVNSDELFTASIFRRIGHLLVAFNYSTLYEKVLSSLTPQESIDERLTLELGFSPETLALTLLQRWNVSSAVCDSFIEGDDVEHIDPMTSAIGATISRICKVGEALARANDPQINPSAPKDWEFAKIALEQTLGKRALGLVRKQLKENLKKYTQHAPQLFKGGIVLDPEMAIAHQWDETHLRQNPYIAHCRGEFRQEMKNFYFSLESGPKEALGKLVKEVFPYSGFAHLCVYTADPSLRVLIPQLKIGKGIAKQGELVRFGDRHDPIGLVFEGSAPYISHESRGGAEWTAVAWLLGVSTRAGVLYAEMPYEDFSRPGEDYLNHFKALCKAFSDALGLE